MLCTNDNTLFKDNTTWVYWGYMQLEQGDWYFLKQCWDDGIYLKIGDTVLINNNMYNVTVGAVFTAPESGLYYFELRAGQGGGVGPVNIANGDGVYTRRFEFSGYEVYRYGELGKQLFKTGSDATVTIDRGDAESVELVWIWQVVSNKLTTTSADSDNYRIASDSPALKAGQAFEEVTYDLDATYATRASAAIWAATSATTSACA